MWRLDATGTAHPDLLVRAALLARYSHDFAGVLRLAHAALAERVQGPERNQAQLLLGEALSELGSFDEAEEVLAGAQREVGTGPLFVPAVAARTRSLTWGLLRTDAALQLMCSARDQVSDAARRDELVAGEALVLYVQGRPADTLRLLDTQSSGAADLRSRVVRAIPESVALTMAGRPESGALLARRGLADHCELGDAVAIAHPGIHVMNELYALREAGRLREGGRDGAGCLRRGDP